MISWIIRMIGKILLRTLILIAIFLAINYFMPKLTHEKLTVWTHVGNSFFEYNFGTREEHLKYMESYETIYGTLRYLDRGPRDGQVIVLIHGIPGSSRTRRHVTARLVDRGYRVIVPDLLGYWASKSTDTTMSRLIERQWIVINNLMKHLSITHRSEWVHDRGSVVTRAQLKEIALYSWTATAQQIDNIILVNAPWYTDWYTPSPLFELHPLVSKAIIYLTQLPLGGEQATRLLLHYDIPDIHAMWTWSLHGYAAPLELGSRKNYAYTISHIDAYQSLLDIYGTIYRQWRIPTTVVRWAMNTTFDSRHQLPFYKKDFWLTDDRIITLLWWHYLQEQAPWKLAQTIDEALRKPRLQ